MKKEVFKQGNLVNKIVAELTMWSKYVIAVLVIWVLNAWSFVPMMVLAGVAALVLGVIVGYALWDWHVYIKYVVIAIELIIFRNSLLLPQFGIPAFAVFLSLPLVGNLIGEVRGERERKLGIKHKSPEHPVLKWLDNVLLSEHMFAVERVFKFFLGIYFTWIFGLASVWNEAIILASFGVIGAVEMAPDVVTKCSLLYTWAHEQVQLHKGETGKEEIEQ